MGLTSSEGYCASRDTQPPARCNGLPTALTLQHVIMLARDVSAPRNICLSLAFERQNMSWSSFYVFFLLSTVLHRISKWSESMWFVCSCQYVMPVSSLPRARTCPALRKNLNTALSWTELPHSQGLCDRRCMTPTLQRGNWRTQKQINVPMICQAVK